MTDIMERIAKVYDKAGTAARNAATYTEFATATDDPLLKFWDEKAPGSDYNNRAFRTIKSHGWCAKALALPEARTFSDIFTDVKLSSQPGLQRNDPRCGRDYGPYSCSAKLYLSGLDADRYICANKHGEFRHFGQKAGKHWVPHVWWNPEVFKAVRDSMLWPAGSCEIIQRTDGQQLVLIRDFESIGSRWVALLDGNQNIEDMLDAEDTARVARHRKQQDDLASCVDGKTIDTERAAALGFDIRRDKYA